MQFAHGLLLFHAANKELDADSSTLSVVLKIKATVSSYAASKRLLHRQVFAAKKIPALQLHFVIKS